MLLNAYLSKEKSANNTYLVGIDEIIDEHTSKNVSYVEFQYKDEAENYIYKFNKDEFNKQRVNSLIDSMISSYSGIELPELQQRVPDIYEDIMKKIDTYSQTTAIELKGCVVPNVTITLKMKDLEFIKEDRILESLYKSESYTLYDALLFVNENTTFSEKTDFLALLIENGFINPEDIKTNKNEINKRLKEALYGTCQEKIEQKIPLSDFEKSIVPYLPKEVYYHIDFTPKLEKKLSEIIEETKKNGHTQNLKTFKENIGLMLIAEKFKDIEEKNPLKIPYFNQYIYDSIVEIIEKLPKTSKEEKSIDLEKSSLDER